MSNTHPEKLPSINHSDSSSHGSDTLSTNFQDKDIVEIESYNEETAATRDGPIPYNYKEDPNNPMAKLA
ncbi:hypothetical protein INT46_007096 [Mucor plumbeus]|uniref:Uncharacterized protein n=1 Tax=Mucor plumbeus TaxID=97098 RepID=A0A8H7VAG5_9FUNG|nr:hypothetical protein INT46_007096 [Mucor plumbeus]